MDRRNLNPNQIAYLRGKRFESEKKIIGGDKKSAEYKKSIAQNGPLNGDTAQRIADEYGIGRNTVKRAEKFAKVVDLLPEEARKNILGGNESIKQKESEAILKFDKPTQKKFLKEKNGITFLTIWQPKIPQPNIYLFPNIYNNISPTVRAFNGGIPFSLIIE